MSFLRAFLLVLGLGLVPIVGLWFVHRSLEAPTLPTARAPAPSAGADPYAVGLLARQPSLLAQAADALRPQRRDRIDLFTIGFGGDGTEHVFANEVDYFARLMATRFDAAGHTLSLFDAPAENSPVPLATFDNLREALRRVGARMDREQDVLVLFLTSHGSHEHYLVVDRPPLMLEQVRPRELREALDAAGIQWRVVIVSACYSGGFVGQLRGPRTLVITAARADRTSFGCGKESKITFFGDAYLAHALNETTDFQLAYSKADKLIGEWERKDGDTPSEPQISAGTEIAAKLDAWRAAAPEPGPPLPYTGQ